MITNDETEQNELEEQLWTATGELQRAVMRLFQDSDIEPYLVVLALARVTGEVGAGTALANPVCGFQAASSRAKASGSSPARWQSRTARVWLASLGRRGAMGGASSRA